MIFHPIRRLECKNTLCCSVLLLIIRPALFEDAKIKAIELVLAIMAFVVAGIEVSAFVIGCMVRFSLGMCLQDEQINDSFDVLCLRLEQSQACKAARLAGTCRSGRCFSTGTDSSDRALCTQGEVPLNRYGGTRADGDSSS